MEMVSVPLNGISPGTHAIKHTSQAEQVAAVIDHLARRLLGRHVGGRADDRAGLGQMGLVAQGPGQAEIEDLDAPSVTFQPEIGRLDVAVDQSSLVRGGQSFGRFPADAQHFHRGQSGLAA